MSTLVCELLRDLESLRSIDKTKIVTINGEPIQSVQIREFKTEDKKPVVDSDGNPVYEEDEDGNEVKDKDGNPVQKITVLTKVDVKIQFTTGKQNEAFKTVAALIDSLGTLTKKEKMSSVYCGDDDIFIVGSAAYRETVNIDTDQTIE